MEPEAVRGPRRLGAVRHPELPEDPLQVALHRLVGEEQLRGDGAVREAARHRLEDLELAGAQPGLTAGLGAGLVQLALMRGLRHHGAGDPRGREVDAAQQHLAEEDGEVGRGDRLPHEGGRAPR